MEWYKYKKTTGNVHRRNSWEKQFRIWNKFGKKYGIGAVVTRKKFALENLLLRRDSIIVGV